MLLAGGVYRVVGNAVVDATMVALMPFIVYLTDRDVIYLCYAFKALDVIEVSHTFTSSEFIIKIVFSSSGDI